MDKNSLKNSILRWGPSIRKYLENLNGRKVLIYGNDKYTIAIAQTAVALGISVKGILSDTLRDDKISVFLPGNLSTQFLSTEYFVLVATLIKHKEAYETLIYNGYKLSEDFAIMGIGGYTKPIDAIDSLLGFSRLNDDIPGFQILGKNIENIYRIVVLGNSTSDPTTAMIPSWCQLVYQKLLDKGYHICLYNGATTGYCSTQEFLKLNRDVLPLKPDLVISFGGYNDIEGTSSVEQFPFLHKYSRKFYEYLKTNPRLAPDSMYMRNVNLVSHGNPDKKEDYLIWIENMKKMKVICDLYSIQFIAYFQPMLENELCFVDLTLDNIINEFYELSNISRQDVHDKMISYNSGVRKELKHYPFIRDLGGIFKNQSNVFYDICHYTETGNELIAEKVFCDLKKFYRGDVKL